MERVQIRFATHEDIPLVTHFLRSMIGEMATLGGHAASTEDAAWTALAQTITENLTDPVYGYFLAERPGIRPTPLGFVAAHMGALTEASAPKRRSTSAQSMWCPPVDGRGWPSGYWKPPWTGVATLGVSKPICMYSSRIRPRAYTNGWALASSN